MTADPEVAAAAAEEAALDASLAAAEAVAAGNGQSQVRRIFRRAKHIHCCVWYTVCSKCT